jgi:hypothetical protein
MFLLLKEQGNLSAAMFLFRARYQLFSWPGPSDPLAKAQRTNVRVMLLKQ